MDKAKIIYDKLIVEMETGFEGGLLDVTTMDMSYHSNKIEGSTLTEDQTVFLYMHDSIPPDKDVIIKADDVVEMKNHFRLFKEMLKTVNEPLSESMIKQYHKVLKSGTNDDLVEEWKIGDYKKISNKVGNLITADPLDVPEEMENLMIPYNFDSTGKSLSDILRFHVQFETIHPFQDGNGRVGRMIMFKECLKNDIIPFIITENTKNYYYDGLRKYNVEPEYLNKYAGKMQDEYLSKADYFLPELVNDSLGEDAAVNESKKSISQKINEADQQTGT